MKLKDLLKGRDRLRKYDELKKWKEKLNRSPYIYLSDATPKMIDAMGLSLWQEHVPQDIRKIIISAIDAEIKKMEEE